MPHIVYIRDATESLDLTGRVVVETDVATIAVVPDGMENGTPSVFIRIDDPGSELSFIAEVSLRVFVAMLEAMKNQHGDGTTISPVVPFWPKGKPRPELS